MLCLWGLNANHSGISTWCLHCRSSFAMTYCDYDNYNHKSVTNSTLACKIIDTWLTLPQVSLSVSTKLSSSDMVSPETRHLVLSWQNLQNVWMQLKEREIPTWQRPEKKWELVGVNVKGCTPIATIQTQNGNSLTHHEQTGSNETESLPVLLQLLALVYPLFFSIA